jgi:hypothetical protein
VSFNLTSMTQGLFFIEEQKYKFLSGIEHLGKKSKLTGLLALPVTVVFSTLEAVKIITLIGESVIKGLANLFGASFNKNCDAKRGVFFLAICIPVAVVLSFTAVQHAMLVFYKTLVEPNDIFKPFKIELDRRENQYSV